MTSIEQTYITNNHVFHNRVMALISVCLQKDVNTRNSMPTPEPPTIVNEDSLTSEEQASLNDYLAETESYNALSRRINTVGGLRNNERGRVFERVMASIVVSGSVNNLIKVEGVIDVEKSITEEVLVVAVESVYNQWTSF
jgi:hypothetical protein